jgi:Bacterial pre-peptidase C-terminal domain
MAINLFDANFYRAANPDLVTAGLTTNEQLFAHFQGSGLREGRAFSALVDLNFYRASNLDLAAAGLTSDSQVFAHLEASGVAEGRRFSAFVDTNFYLANNADVNRAFGGNREQALRHLMASGISEGRTFSPFANINYYLQANPDVNQFYRGNRVQALHHLVINGINEGRPFSPFVDLKLYLTLNTDTNRAFGSNFKQALESLATEGISQGRRFSLAYDSVHYKAVNSDLANLNNDALLQHFQQFGLNEGRASSALFNVRHYLSVNTDLARAGFNFQQAFQHFITNGFREGRTGAPAITLNGDPGNSMSGAFNLDFLTTNRTYTNFVGISDKTDFYRFNLNVTRNIGISVNGVTEAIDLELIQDTNGNGIYDDSDIDFYTSGSNNFPASMSKTLGAGTYFIRVEPYFSNGNTNYTLNLSTSPALITTPRDPGESFTNALPIVLGQSFRDFVGISDFDDIYRFSLDRTHNINLSVDGLTESIDLYLAQDTNGNGVYDDSDKDYYDNGSSSSPASMSKTLGAGTYFIRVQPYFSDGNTSYNLRLSGSPSAVTTPRDPGNTLGTALSIGFGQSFTDFVGIFDLRDYYSFSVGSTRNVTATVNGVTDSVDLYLIQDSNGNGIYDDFDVDYYASGSSNSSASITRTLGAGTYYILVEPYFSDGNTNYTLLLR